MTTELDLVPDTDRAPATLFASPDPAAIVAQATRIADHLAPVITDRHLYAPISGKKYPTLEAWTLLGMLMPTTVSPHVTRTWQTENGWGAHAEARTLEGRVVSAADAYCMRDEEKWEGKPSHQVASMASTRACSRAMRLPLSFVMSLTGYEVTPAEEMEAAVRGETVSGGKDVRPGWKDLGEQQRGHADVGKTIEEHGLRQWVAEWIASKGYGPRPWAKGQLTQLRRAIEQEVHWRQQSDPPTEQVCQYTSSSSGAPCLELRGASVHESRDVYHGDVLERAHPFQPQMSDPPSQPTPPGWESGGSDTMSPPSQRARAVGGGDPTSGMGATGASSQPVPDQTSPSDVRRGSLAKGGDSTSGAGERETASSTGDTAGGARLAATHDRHDPAPDPTSVSVSMAPKGPPSPATDTDPMSPPADPIAAPEAEGTAGQGGDANAGPAEPDPPRANGVLRLDTGDSAGPAYPVEEWAINQDPPVDLRVAKVALRKEFKKDFGWLQNWNSLRELQGEQAINAIKALEAIYLDPGGKP